MTAHIVRGDARRLPLADASVDLIVTSPPYYALRSYTDGGRHYDGQIGSEPTPQEYIDNLIACTAEWMRVLKPAGSIFVDLGDKYAERAGPGHPDRGDDTVSFRTERPRRRQVPGIRPKSLMLLPERYRIACVDQLGLIARAVICWAKPNGLPESVTDRVRRSHEDWVHLVKQPRYYSAIDHIRQPSTPQKGQAGTFARRNPSHTLVPGQSATQHRTDRPDVPAYNPLGALPGSVWEIPTEPLTVPDHLGIDHFAAFPTEWPRRIILGWSPSGICTACGEGRRPTSEHERHILTGSFGQYANAHGADGRTGRRATTTATITGEACGCPDTTAPTRPSVIIDPFGGTGTVALVAHALGRTGITVDMSADYCRLAAWRTTDRGELAKAMRVDKPPKQVNGQDGLFDLTGGGL